MLKIILLIPDGVSNAWVGNAIIPADYFPPGVNKMILTAVHNTGKQPEVIKCMKDQLRFH